MRLAFLLMLLAGPAQALSCMRPSIVDSFHRAEEVPQDVYLLKGRLTFDEGLLPKTDHSRTQIDPAPIPAQFDGFALNRDGFTTPYPRAVTLQPLCFGPWCGTAAAGEEAIMFATLRGTDLVIEASPCGGDIFYDPTAKMERDAILCINGACPPAAPQR